MPLGASILLLICASAGAVLPTPGGVGSVHAGIQFALVTFYDVAQRAYAISFDPYDCIELRWGAGEAERATCQQSQKKLRWYEAEQRLRNDPARSTSEAYDLDELEHSSKGSEPPPPVDVRGLIENMPWQVPLEPMHPVGR